MKASLNRRRLEKPLAKATSVTGQRRLGEQLFRQQEPSCQQQLDRRHAELLLDDPPDLSRAQLELLGDRLEPGLLVV